MEWGQGRKWNMSKHIGHHIGIHYPLWNWAVFLDNSLSTSKSRRIWGMDLLKVIIVNWEYTLTNNLWKKPTNLQSNSYYICVVSIVLFLKKFNWLGFCDISFLSIMLFIVGQSKNKLLNIRRLTFFINIMSKTNPVYQLWKKIMHMNFITWLTKMKES